LQPFTQDHLIVGSRVARDSFACHVGRRARLPGGSVRRRPEGDAGDQDAQLARWRSWGISLLVSHTSPLSRGCSVWARARGRRLPGLRPVRAGTARPRGGGHRAMAAGRRDRLAAAAGTSCQSSMTAVLVPHLDMFCELPDPAAGTRRAEHEDSALPGLGPTRLGLGHLGLPGGRGARALGRSCLRRPGTEPVREVCRTR